MMMNERLNVKELAAIIASKHQLTLKDAEHFINQMFHVIEEGLEADKIVKVKGLGTFKVVAVNSRKSVDVNTGEAITIDARDKISFAPDIFMRDMVNKPFMQFDTVILNEGVDFTEVDQKYEDLIDDPNEDNPQTQNDQQKILHDTQPSVTPEQQSSTHEKQFINRLYLNEKAISMKPENEEKKLIITPQQMDVLNDEVKKINTEETEQDSYETEKSQEEKPHEIRFVQEDLGPQFVSTQDLKQEVSDEESAPHQDHSSQETPRCQEFEEPNLDTPIEENIPPIQDVEVSQPHTDERQESTSAIWQRLHQRETAREEKPITSDAQTISITGDAQVVTDQNTRQNQSNDLQQQQEQATADGNFYAYEAKKMGYKKYNQLLLACVIILLILIGLGSFYIYKELEIKDNRIAHLEALLNDNKLESTANKEEEKNIKEQASKTDNKERIQAEEETEEVVEETPKAVEKMADQKVTKQPESKVQPVVKEEKMGNVSKEEKPQKPATPAVTKAESGEFSKYDSDPQIKHGAYKIVGIAQTITVKKGQTLFSLSKNYLGDGMECYMKALNGGSDQIKEGQKLRIPKLQLKNKK